jgi:hypothetical protein
MMLMQTSETFVAVATQCITLFFAKLMQDDAVNHSF